MRQRGQKQGSGVKSVLSLVSAVTLGRLPNAEDTEVSLFWDPLVTEGSELTGKTKNEAGEGQAQLSLALRATCPEQAGSSSGAAQRRGQRTLIPHSWLSPKKGKKEVCSLGFLSLRLPFHGATLGILGRGICLFGPELRFSPITRLCRGLNAHQRFSPGPVALCWPCHY